MNYEKIVKMTKKIESKLEEWGAEGRGLHEKLTSIETNIPESIVKKIRFIASIRNQLIHDDNFEMTDELMFGFQKSYDDFFHWSDTKEQREKDRQKKNSEKNEEPDATDNIVVTVVVGALALAALYFFS